MKKNIFYLFMFNILLTGNVLYSSKPAEKPGTSPVQAADAKEQNECLLTMSTEETPQSYVKKHVLTDLISKRSITKTVTFSRDKSHEASVDLQGEFTLLPTLLVEEQIRLRKDLESLTSALAQKGIRLSVPNNYEPDGRSLMALAFGYPLEYSCSAPKMTGRLEIPKDTK